jgi:hypothetical protein
MTAYDWDDGRGLKGFRPDQVAAAFDRVRDHRDWKAPIRCTIQASERAVVAVAIQWFTGTTAEFIATPDAPNTLIVHAPGQRLGPAGVPDELSRGVRPVVTAADDPARVPQVTADQQTRGRSRLRIENGTRSA